MPTPAGIDVLLARAAAFSRRHALLQPGDLVLAGFSAGPDSTLLAEFLRRAGELGFPGVRVALLHLNHGAHAGAGECEAQARAYAAAAGLELVVERADAPALARRWKCGLEAAGRRARLEFFARVMRERGAARVALGHTLDDHAETILARLIRGCGPEGLLGIAPLRRFRQPAGLVVARPLRSLRRAEVRAALAGATVYQDPTNDDDSRPRNVIRRALMPLVETRLNPRFAQALERLSAALEQTLGPAPDAAAYMLPANAPGEIALDAAGLAGLDGATLARVLARALGAFPDTARRLETAHLEALGGLARGRSGRSLTLPGRVVARREGRAVVLRGPAAGGAGGGGLA
ncbi:MAG: tRNA lysidine(34) synthetase TilS [Planctomycetes bacterium]|nr:tRNA lysidine(34) synthetase TilS [Planctomycetota bacterium]